MDIELYWGIALFIGVVVFFYIGRTEVWDDVMDEEFGLYLMGILIRTIVAGAAGAAWFAAIPLLILVAILWLPWAAKQQKRHIRIYGKPDEDYDWRYRLGLQREKVTNDY